MLTFNGCDPVSVARFWGGGRGVRVKVSPTGSRKSNILTLHNNNITIVVVDVWERFYFFPFSPAILVSPVKQNISERFPPGDWCACVWCYCTPRRPTDKKRQDKTIELNRTSSSSRAHGAPCRGLPEEWADDDDLYVYATII